MNEGSLQAARETLGAGSLAVRADVSNLNDLDMMFATIKREFGHLDGIFVNAGYSEFLLFEEVTEQTRPLGRIPAPRPARSRYCRR